ncbi:uncharacterized protein BJ171DRAFT_568851, partial [Polychytrium aggregatum]|uniref:uncharacterized protein n=1 Tax=Polychytrium aggregatum TaxID=110093 RepID=UPI0022FDCE11
MAEKMTFLTGGINPGDGLESFLDSETPPESLGIFMSDPQLSSEPSIAESSRVEDSSEPSDCVDSAVQSASRPHPQHVLQQALALESMHPSLPRRYHGKVPEITLHGPPSNAAESIEGLSHGSSETSKAAPIDPSETMLSQGIGMGSPMVYSAENEHSSSNAYTPVADDPDISALDTEDPSQLPRSILNGKPCPNGALPHMFSSQPVSQNQPQRQSDMARRTPPKTTQHQSFGSVSRRSSGEALEDWIVPSSPLAGPVAAVTAATLDRHIIRLITHWCTKVYVSMASGPSSYAPYAKLVKSLYVARPLAEKVLAGDLDIVLQLLFNLEQFKIDAALSTTNILVQSLGDHGRQLRSVALSGSPVTDASILVLIQSCKQLQHLELGDTLCTCGVLDLVVSHGPSIQNLDLRRALAASRPLTWNPQAGAQIHNRTPVSLAKLDLTQSKTTNELIWFSIPMCRHLVWVQISGCTELGDESVIQIVKACRLLAYLDCSSVAITDLALLAIGMYSTKLRLLRCSCCSSITAEGVRFAVTGCPIIEELDLDDCPAVQESFVSEYSLDRSEGRCRIMGDSIKWLARYFRVLKKKEQDDIAEELVPGVSDMEYSQHPGSRAHSQSRLEAEPSLYRSQQIANEQSASAGQSYGSLGDSPSKVALRKSSLDGAVQTSSKG